MTKIFITGSAGTGKSTVAQKLAKKLNIQYYETDILCYSKEERRMLTIHEIKEKINIDSDWIIDGAYIIPDYISMADKVIYMETTLIKSIYRIWARRFRNPIQTQNYSFWSTIMLTSNITNDKLSNKKIIERSKPNFYCDKDRFDYVKENAKELEIIRT